MTIHPNPFDLPTPPQLSRLLVERMRHELRIRDGFRAPLAMIAQNFDVSVSMIKQVMSGNRSFSRRKFEELANQQQQPLGAYLADLMRWGNVQKLLEQPTGESREYKYANSHHEDQAASASEARTADMDTASVLLEARIRDIRANLRKDMNETHANGSPRSAEEEMPIIMLLFSAICSYINLINPMMIKSVVVLIDRLKGEESVCTSGVSKWYALTRQENSSDDSWAMEHSSLGALPLELFDAIGEAWQEVHETKIMSFLHLLPTFNRNHEESLDQFLYALGRTENPTYDAANYAIIQPVHSYKHPCHENTCNITRTTLMLVTNGAFVRNDIARKVILNLLRVVADTLEVQRLFWANSLKGTHSTKTQLGTDCHRAIVELLDKIELAVLEAIGTTDRKDATERKTASALLAFDFWLLDANDEFVAAGESFSRVLPRGNSEVVIVDGRTKCWREYYREHLDELRPSASGGKSLSALREQCWLNINRSYQKGRTPAVKNIERGNQVAVPFMLRERQRKPSESAYGVCWFRFYGDNHENKDIAKLLRKIDMTIRESDKENSGVELQMLLKRRPSRPLSKARLLEIEKAAEAGDKLLKSHGYE